MRKTGLALGLILICAAVGAQADDSDTSSTPPPSMSGMGHGRHGGKRAQQDGSSSKNSKSVRGHCVVLESPGNPFTGPCVNTLLVLNDDQGNELFQARTDTNGVFEFVVDQDTKYHLAPSSKLYDLVSPTAVVHSGDQVEVRLKQK